MDSTPAASSDTVFDSVQESLKDACKMHVMLLDYYMSPPDTFQHEHPIIRIYGCMNTLTDERITSVCHIHQIYPYCYFRPENIHDTTFATITQVEKYLPSWEYKLDMALNATKSFKKKQIVKLEAVLKKTLYGYFANDKVFVKVTLYNPMMIKTLVRGLESGGLLTAKMQTYESHIPMLLQFVMDYGIYPQGWLYLHKINLRGPIDTERFTTHLKTSDGIRQWPVNTLQQDILTNFNSAEPISHIAPLNQSQPNAFSSQVASLLEGITVSQLQASQTFESRQDSFPCAYIEKISTCDFEFDALNCDILNATITPSKFGNELWEEERQRRAAVGKTLETPFTPPSTHTDHHIIEPHEEELLHRLERLKAKGELLYRMETGQADETDEPWLTQLRSTARDNVARDAALADQYIDALTPSVVYEDLDAVGVADVETEVVLGIDEEEDYDGEHETQEILRSQVEEPAVADVIATTPVHDRPEPVILPSSQEGGKYSQALASSRRSSSNRPPRRSMASVFSKRKQARFHDEIEEVVHVSEFEDRFNRDDDTAHICGTELMHNDVVEVVASLENPDDSVVISTASTLVNHHVTPVKIGAIRVGSSLLLRSSLSPPSYSQVVEEAQLGLYYSALFYSNPKDIEGSVQKSNRNTEVQQETCSLGLLVNHALSEGFRRSTATRFLLPTFAPPSRSLVAMLCNQDGHSKRMALKESSQIETPLKTAVQGGFTNRHNMNMTLHSEFKSRMTIFSIEIFCCNRQSSTKRELLPCPKSDPVQIICWHCRSIAFSSTDEAQETKCGILCVHQIADTRTNTASNLIGSPEYQRSLLLCDYFPDKTDVMIVPSEKDLFIMLIRLVRSMDPEFIVAYDIQRSSIGYLCKRASEAYSIDLLQELSRIPLEEPSKRNDYDKYDEDHDSGIFITGRIVLNIWRLMRKELKLNSYNIENVVLQLLNRRIPSFTPSQLTRWFKTPKQRHRVARHMFRLSDANLQMLDKLDLLRRTSEFARLYGIDFYSVISRGSQYKVEAVLLRRAHSEGFIAISPSKEATANQAAMEVKPLILEPRSSFYPDPVVVLDFQSLYPSMMIAYNICFSTILGKVSVSRNDCDTTERLGTIEYPESLTASAVYQHVRRGWQDPVMVSNGSIFCSKDCRQGLVPKILEEMLALRQMIKRSMKEYKQYPECSVLCRVLEARQLAIKMLSNVTYGYTAAGFSGRMPMAEVADAIVQRGRDTLKWSIREVCMHPSWKAEVHYGDTDSMFVGLSGRTKEAAFRIGEEIVDYITCRYSPAVVLKLEKVYLPCILVTMKRYVGWSYESIHSPPSFDAKGIEIVRRDTCAVVAKMQEQMLRILFETRDLSKVKAYLMKQWTKLWKGGAYLNIQDFVFAKEVRLGSYRGIGPPGAIVAQKMLDLDPNAETPHYWRVPYIVVYGNAGGGNRLIDLVVSPEALLIRGNGLVLNIKYYIDKCINPALQRILILCGVNHAISTWYAQVNRSNPRLRKVVYAVENMKKPVLTTIDSFFLNKACEFCGKHSKSAICPECLQDKPRAYASIISQLNCKATVQSTMQSICQNCTQHSQALSFLHSGELLGPDCCSSISCSFFQKRYRLMLELEDLNYVLTNVKW